MIAADTSTWIAHLHGDAGADTERLQQALAERQVWMVPAVLAELLSEPALASAAARALVAVPLAETSAGYWERAGRLRSQLLATGRKARLGDALIAQTCLDHGLVLLTRDRDFGAFAALGLQAVING